MNTNKLKTRVIIFGVILAIIVMFVMGITFANSDETYANAYNLRENDFTVEQVGKLYYCGENYLNSESNKELLLSALSFKLDGTLQSVGTHNTIITCDEEIFEPRQYRCNVLYIKNEIEYIAENVLIEIEKKQVQVVTLLNGETNLAINEGQKIYVAYNYVGAIEADTHIETSNGVLVTQINENRLTRPAYVASIPTYPTNNYTVVANYAESLYYTFTYPKSLLTINELKVSQLVSKSKDKVLASLTGQFNITYTLDFKNVGINSQDKEYAKLYLDVEKKYGASELLDKNEIIACYSINVKDKAGEIPKEGMPAYAKIQLSEENRGYKKYSVVALYNNGNTEILNAELDSEGYLIFNAADMGNFVVVAPINELGTSAYIIAIVVGISIILVVILLFTVFRRKF